MSVAGWVVLGDESAVEGNLNVKRIDPYRLTPGSQADSLGSPSMTY